MKRKAFWTIGVLSVAVFAACGSGGESYDDLLEEYQAHTLTAKGIVEQCGDGSIDSDNDYCSLMMEQLGAMHSIWQQMDDDHMDSGHMGTGHMSSGHMDGEPMLSEEQLEWLMDSQMEMFNELEEFEQVCVGPEMDADTCDSIRPGHLSHMNELLEDSMEMCESMAGNHMDHD